MRRSLPVNTRCQGHREDGKLDKPNLTAERDLELAALRRVPRSKIRGVRTHPILLDRPPPQARASHSTPQPLVQLMRDHAHAERLGESHPDWRKLTRLAGSFASLPETRHTRVRGYSSSWPCAPRIILP